MGAQEFINLLPHPALGENSRGEFAIAQSQADLFFLSYSIQICSILAIEFLFGEYGAKEAHNGEIILCPDIIHLMTMKRSIGLCILLILLIAASGCTQPASKQPDPATVVPTDIPTAAATTAATPAEEIQVVVVTEETTPEVTAVMTPVPQLTYAKKPVIAIRNNTFVPHEMLVLPGTGITWINEDSTVHAVKTMPDTGIKFSSGDIIKGASFGYTFGDKEGTFSFIDPYTNATGIIRVQKGASVVGAPTQQATASATN